MFVSCRFLREACELESYNFFNKEVVMDDEQVEQRWALTWQVNFGKYYWQIYRADAQTLKSDTRFRSTACQRGIIRVISVWSVMRRY